MQLDAVLLFGGSGKYTVNMKIFEGRIEPPNVARNAYGPSVHEFVANDAEMVAVELENGLTVQPGQVYTIACTIQGEQSYYGSSGNNQSISNECSVGFKWIASDSSPNGTGTAFHSFYPCRYCGISLSECLFLTVVIVLSGVSSGQIGGFTFSARQSGQPSKDANGSGPELLPKLPALLEHIESKDWSLVEQLLAIATDAMSVVDKSTLAIDDVHHNLAHDSTALTVWKPSTETFTPDPSMSPPARMRRQLEAPWSKCYLSPSAYTPVVGDMHTHKKREQNDEPSMSFSASPDAYSPVSESYSPSASYSPVAHSAPSQCASSQTAPSQQTDSCSQSASLSPSQASQASHQQSTERWSHTEFIAATAIQLLKTAIQNGSSSAQEEHAGLVSEVCSFFENCIASINYYHPLVCEAAKEAYAECFTLFFPSWTMRRALLVRMLSDVALQGVNDFLAFPLFEAFCTCLMKIEGWTVALGFEAGAIASDDTLAPMQKTVSNLFIEANLEIVVAANEGGDHSYPVESI